MTLRPALARALTHIISGALIGALMGTLIPGSGVLYLIPAGIGCVLAVPLLVAAYQPASEEPDPPGDTTE
ncbi:hypothetical protein [Arthrobacter sp. CG_A4]|uniref:hypothetical protein n=1 Tax=Arthrobacter sp. CG_A4 TaxID=3071706 RepID=UPI002DF85DC7|nr:hypothetical protein [Arthrobacter sp. CG_A4]